MKQFVTLLILVFTCAHTDEPPNYCHDSETNAHWESIAVRAITNSDVIGLYKFRKKLFAQIDNDEISIKEGTEIFENERERVVEKLKAEKA